MKKIIPIILAILLLPLSVFATCTAGPWYAQASSTNINAASEWNTTPAGGGTVLTWGSQCPNDIFYANNKTNLAVNADPSVAPTTLTGTVTITFGSTTMSGSGTSFTTQVVANDWVYITGQPPVQVASITNDTTIVLAQTPWFSASGTAYDGIVTLSTAAGSGTAGGGFTYATNPGLSVFHAILAAGTTNDLVVTGSSGQFNQIGAAVGSSTGGIAALNYQATSITGYFIGNAFGGSFSPGAYGIDNAGGGTLAVTGFGYAGTNNGGAIGIEMNGSGSISILGGCIGSDSSWGIGCSVYSGIITLAGILLNGNDGTAAYIQHNGGHFYFTPSSTNYILYPKNSSATLGVPNSNSVEMPMNPGVANVASGVNYGTFTGTAVAGGGGAYAQ